MLRLNLLILCFALIVYLISCEIDNDNISNELTLISVHENEDSNTFVPSKQEVYPDLQHLSEKIDLKQQEEILRIERFLNIENGHYQDGETGEIVPRLHELNNLQSVGNPIRAPFDSSESMNSQDNNIGGVIVNPTINEFEFEDRLADSNDLNEKSLENPVDTMSLSSAISSSLLEEISGHDAHSFPELMGGSIDALMPEISVESTKQFEIKYSENLVAQPNEQLNLEENKKENEEKIQINSEIGGEIIRPDIMNNELVQNEPGGSKDETLVDSVVINTQNMDGRAETDPTFMDPVWQTVLNEQSEPVADTNVLELTENDKFSDPVEITVSVSAVQNNEVNDKEVIQEESALSEEELEGVNDKEVIQEESASSDEPLEITASISSVIVDETFEVTPTEITEVSEIEQLIAENTLDIEMEKSSLPQSAIAEYEISQTDLDIHSSIDSISEVEPVISSNPDSSLVQSDEVSNIKKDKEEILLKSNIEDSLEEFPSKVGNEMEIRHEGNEEGRDEIILTPDSSYETGYVEEEDFSDTHIKKESLLFGGSSLYAKSKIYASPLEQDGVEDRTNDDYTEEELEEYYNSDENESDVIEDGPTSWVDKTSNLKSEIVRTVTTFMAKIKNVFTRSIHRISMWINRIFFR